MIDEEILKKYNYCCDKLSCLIIANSWNNLLKLDEATRASVFKLIDYVYTDLINKNQ